jgi:hypothetical protein
MKMRKINISDLSIIKTSIYLITFGLVLTVKTSYGQSMIFGEPRENNPVILNDGRIVLDAIHTDQVLSKANKDTSNGLSIFPKGIPINPEMKGIDHTTTEIDSYRMPIIYPKGNHAMRIHVPDSTILYTMKVKKIGTLIDGFEK